LHKKGVIHFDIKPLNIFLDELERIKLGDLGLARNFKSLSSNPAFRGTLLYSSPEVIMEESVNFKMDIWSFGCVLYEMITLQPLFANKPLHMIISDIINKEIVIPSNIEDANLAFVLKK
jgi:serine/threonine protein kinase